MTFELIIIIACCLIALLGIISYIYKKKTGKEITAINFISTIAVNALAEYVNENGKKDAKKYEDFNEYIIHVKDILIEKMNEYVKNNEGELPSYIVKLIQSESANDILDDIINREINFLEETFTETQKKSKKSK